MLHKLDAIPVTTSLEQVLQALRLEEPEDIEMICGLYEAARKVAKPKALYREAFVEDVSGEKVRVNGVEFHSGVVAMNLKNVHRVFAFVCTCGTEVDDWSHGEKDYIVSLWLDMIKQMFLQDASEYLRAHIQRVYQISGISAVNPGSGNLENWPIAQQKPLFAMIGDVKAEIGVTLTDSYLMLPIKSTSGLIFPSDMEFTNCALCTRESCKGRRVPFDQKLYAEAFLR